jgi:ABC-type hemin transport system substrate-binding protein
MLNSNSFDTICHEHLEYYSLCVIDSLLKKHQLRIISVEFNSINGGSIAVTAAKHLSSHKASKLVDWAINNEKKLALDTNAPYEKFAMNVQNLKTSLKDLVFAIQSDGKTIAALGASTKGNVLLQYCGLTSEDLASIGEVNPDKYGRVTPGSRINIVSEDAILDQNPDYILILPWHFKEYMVNKIRQSASRNCKIILPLPNIEILS